MAVSVLRRYITRELVLTAGVITLVLLLIVLSARLIVYLNKAATGELSTQLVFSIVGLNLPFFLQLILPLGFFISLLLVIGRMYAENEMVVLNACGIGPRQLLKTITIPTLIITLVCGVLSLWLAPLGAAQVDRLLEEQKSQTDLKFITPGRFTNLGRSNQVTYTEQTLQSGTGLQGVFVGNPEGILIADAAHQATIGDQDDRYLSLDKGYQFNVKPDGEVEILSFNTYSMKIAEGESVGFKSRQEAKPTMSILHSENPKEMAQLSLRIAMVVMIPIAAFLGFPLAKVQPRQGRFVKLLPAILLYVLYYSMIILATSLIADGKVPPETGVWWVHLLFLALALLFNFKEDFQSYRKGQKLLQEASRGAH